ncbi:MAG: hypothetical protein HQL12_00900 [Candidatus Omnitrophica bacterium]|nr:hypothetical protein [Candidatus Omnitrophota bacterium]
MDAIIRQAMILRRTAGIFLGVLAYNMAQAMKLFYLCTDAVVWTIKIMRYQFINVCGKVVRSGRKYSCKIINVTHEVFERFKYCQMKMLSA